MSSIHPSAQAKMICDAIKHKRRLSFYYHDKERIGEPQCCGVSTAGNEVARMRLIKGGSRPEQLFEIALITSLTPLNDHFALPGPNYKRNDSAMREIYCQL